jgi:hypothetical protein
LCPFDTLYFRVDKGNLKRHYFNKLWNVKMLQLFCTFLYLWFWPPTHNLLLCWRKIKAIYLIHFWAFVACSREDLIFSFTSISDILNNLNITWNTFGYIRHVNWIGHSSVFNFEIIICCKLEISVNSFLTFPTTDRKNEAISVIHKKKQ